MRICPDEIKIILESDGKLLESRADILLEKYDARFLLLIFAEKHQTQVVFVSGSKKIRAIEIMEYLMPVFGLVKGNAQMAKGCISLTILNSLIADTETTDAVGYFKKKVTDYIEETVCIVADEYMAEAKEELTKLPVYIKKKVKWAVVKSTDVASPGEKILVKSLENSTGKVLEAGDECLIMIGNRGETYDISRKKFESTYELTDEKLNIFEEMLNYIPEITLLDSGEYVTLDEMAKICYPKHQVKIYAVELTERTKIFQGDGTGEYFLGLPGDYMAVRYDDLSDMYIIRKEIFEQTYDLYEEKKL